MSDAQCMLCVWLSEQPVALQILGGVAIVVVLVPAILWALAVLTPRLDEQLERHLADHMQPTTASRESASAQALKPPQQLPTTKLSVPPETELASQKRSTSS